MNPTRRITFFLAVSILAIAALIFIFSDFNREESHISENNKIEDLTEAILTEEKTTENDGCDSIRAEEDIVNGNSLSGLIEDEEKVLIYYGYYDCYEVERGDFVIYKYAGRETPLIKTVKAVPGDSFGLKRGGSRWNILVNGEILKNSQGYEYSLNDSAYKMLHLYEEDYGGVIPQNAYLILGNLVTGTLDSTHFGLINKNNILGKAVPLPGS